MLQRLVDDFRAGAGSAVRLTSLAVAVAMSLFVTTGFLSAAAFMFVLPREGAVAACFAGGAAFLVVGTYDRAKRQDGRQIVVGQREHIEATGERPRKHLERGVAAVRRDRVAVEIEAERHALPALLRCCCSNDRNIHNR